MKSRVLYCFLCLMALGVMALPLSAQNIVVNGDFETANGQNLFESQYTYKSGGQISEGEFCIDNTVTGHGGGTLGGWVQPSGSTGKFMLVNGWGTSAAPNKVVWKQTLYVTSNTQYAFSFKYATLSNSYGLGNPAQIKAVLKKDGAVIREFSLITLNQSDHSWHQYPNTNWQSNSVYGNVTLEFYDMYTGNSNSGDDFALDDISFVPNVYYSVQANPDPDNSVCLNQYIDIDVLANDVVTPNNNDATVSVVSGMGPSYGTAVPQSNKKIRYTYTGGGTTDQFKYRVTIHGAYAEAWVYINTNQPPTVPDIQAPDGFICAGSPLGIAAPSVNPPGHWEIASGPGGPWSTLSNPNSIGLEYNNYYVHYTTSNECGPSSSNAVQIHVSDEPNIPTPVTPSAICAGSSFSLTVPTPINDYGSSIFNAGWQISSNQSGPFNAFNNENVAYDYNGYYIRYFAENACGISYSACVPITVNDVPIVGAITAPSGICEHQSFSLTSPSVEWRHNDATTCSGSWEIQINGVWQPLTNNNIPYEYNGCSIRYKAINGCDTSYSPNNVQVTVYSTAPIDEGEITACDAIMHHGVMCDHTGPYSFDSITPNNCTIHVSWQFTLGEAYVAPVEYITACDSYYWPHSHHTYSTSGIYDTIILSGNPMICDSTFTLDLTINHAPTIQGDLQTPSDICVGSLLAVIWPQSEGGTSRWDYSTSQYGPFQSFDPDTYHFNYGRYYLRFAAINDCDSTFSNVVSFFVSDRPTIDGQLQPLQVCVGNPLDLPDVNPDFHNATQSGDSEWQMSEFQGGPYASFNQTIPMQMGQDGYWVRYMARNECGEVYLGPVRITVIDEREETVDHVDCDTVWFEGVPYTEDRVVDEVLHDPCLHTIHHNIVVHHSNLPETDPTLIEEVVSCHDEFEWHGHIYLRIDGPQTVTWTTQNEWGCDSIRELHLDFGDYAQKTEPYLSCDSFTWHRNDSTYYYDGGNQSQQVVDFIFIPGDEVICDSMIYLNLTLGPSHELEGEPMTECYGFEWHGVPYYEDAIVYDTLKTTNITRCDSIISHQLTIIQPVYWEDVLVSCKPEWWNGHQFLDDGEVFTASLESPWTGCDSIVTMHFSLTDEILNPVDTIACDAFTWFGHTFIENEEWSHTFSTPQGCDSTVRLNVTFVQTDVQSIDTSACNQFEFNGHTYGPDYYEIYYDTVLMPNGCISEMKLLKLTVVDSDLMGSISGPTYVYVASSLNSGIYRYDIDREGIIGPITWSLSNPDWQIVDSTGFDFCRVMVTSPGTALLIASFNVEDCGVMERTFEIVAGYFGVDDIQKEVRIFPNPTQGTVTIEAEGIECVRVMDMMGQTLDMLECGSSDSVKVNMKGYSPSVYLLEVKTAIGAVRRRVVVCR